MAEWEWDEEGNEYVERILKEILPLILSQTEEALKEVLAKARYFVSFNDLTRYILSALEEKVRLSPEAREFIYRELKKIYEKTAEDVLRDFPIRYEFNVADQRAIEYATKLHDFYLGRFFQGDRELRLRVLSWMSRYYLEEGNPIGRGQKGIQEFLERFGQYIKPQTEWKARQIIDTSVNFLRNSARLRAMQKAGIRKFRWDAIGDRLTCSACRSMDGRIFEVREAVRVLDAIEGSEDPSILKELRPIVSTPYRGSSQNAPVKSPPAHPHCYDESTEVYTDEGWKLFKELRGDEKILSLNPITLDLEWLPIRRIIKWYHKGYMLHFFHRHLDLMVTDQHSMLVYFRKKQKGRKEGFYFETAEWCKEHKWDYWFYRSSKWKGTKPRKILFGNIEFEPEYFVKLMGYYLAEGSTSINPEGKYVIKIAQSNQERLQKIYDDLKGGPLKIWKGKNCLYLKAPSKEFGKALKDLGKAHEKKVPEIIKQLTPDLIRTFLMCYTFGDGTVKKGKKWKGGNFRDSITLFTSSKKLADDLGELILKAGYHPSFYLMKVKGKTQKFRNGTYTINHDVWRITIKHSKFASREHISVGKVPYEGYVYCVELPKNHTLWVRRNGQTVWCGNCRCRIVSWIEEFEEELPTTVERPPGVPDTPVQRELEEEYSALTRAEITNRIRAHLGSEWARPPAKPKERDIKNFLERYVKSHFEKHGHEVGVKSLEEYRKKALDIIRNPEKVYVERRGKSTSYIFYKGDLKVVCSDDHLSINSFYREDEETWLKRVTDTFGSAVIRIL